MTNNKITPFEELAKNCQSFANGKDYWRFLAEIITQSDIDNQTDIYLWKVSVGHFSSQISSYIKRGFDKERIYRDLYSSLFTFRVSQRDDPELVKQMLKNSSLRASFRFGQRLKTNTPKSASDMT